MSRSYREFLDSQMPYSIQEEIAYQEQMVYLATLPEPDVYHPTQEDWDEFHSLFKDSHVF